MNLINTPHLHPIQVCMIHIRINCKLTYLNAAIHIAGFEIKINIYSKNSILIDYLLFEISLLTLFDELPYENIFF